MKRLVAGVLAVVVFTLAACGNGDEPIDMITPTPWSTPRPSVPPAPDPSRDARETYERYSAELYRILQAGGASELGPVLTETTGDDHQVTVLQLLRTVKERRIRSVGVNKITIVETVVEGPDEVRLYICEDTTQTRWIDEAGNETALDGARFFETESVVSQIDDRWKITDAETTRLQRFSDSSRCRDAS